MATAMIYGLIQQAMGKIGAIGKDAVAKDKSGREQYKFRGIDAVYNALNPVMAELGLFICPEIIDQQREERTTQSGGVLKYTILTIKFTMYAPDGSNVSMTVVGEGMDSGDKSANKAMSVGLKYAMFQLFMIPTEEMVDPDGEVHDSLNPKNAANKQEGQKEFTPPPAAQGTVSNAASLPPVNQTPPPEPTPPPQAEPTEAQKYLLSAMKQLREDRKISAQQNNKLFADQFKALVAEGLAPDKRKEEYTLEEAHALIDAMYKNFGTHSAELIKK